MVLILPKTHGREAEGRGEAEGSERERTRVRCTHVCVRKRETNLQYTKTLNSSSRSSLPLIAQL